MKILSSYQKLKKKVADQEKAYNRLKHDFRRYARGDFGVKTHYDTMFKFEDDLEKTIWAGNSNEQERA